MPVKKVQELSWKNFAGWQVTHDSQLLALIQLAIATENARLSDYIHIVDLVSGETDGTLVKIR